LSTLQSSGFELILVTLADLINPALLSEDQARACFERLRWPEGAVCPECGKADSSIKLKLRVGARTHSRFGTHQCRQCRKQYTVTAGTIFEDSHIPLRKWMMAIEAMSSSNKELRAMDVQRLLELGSYRTAWRMCRRLRWAFLRPAGMVKIKLPLEEAIQHLLLVSLEPRDRPGSERAKGAKLERRPRKARTSGIT
jgi:transposase-like protein